MTDDPGWLEELAGRLLARVQMPCTVDELTIEVGRASASLDFQTTGATSTR